MRTFSTVLSWAGLVGGVLCLALLLVSPFVREVGEIFVAYPHIWIGTTVVFLSLIVLAAFVSPPDGRDRRSSWGGRPMLRARRFAGEPFALSKITALGRHFLQVSNL